MQDCYNFLNMIKQSCHQCHWRCHLWPAAGLFWRWLRLALSSRCTVPYDFLQRTSLQAPWYQNITAETYADIGTKIQLQKVLSVSSMTTQVSRWGARTWVSLQSCPWKAWRYVEWSCRSASVCKAVVINRDLGFLTKGTSLRICQNGEELASLVTRVLNKE